MTCESLQLREYQLSDFPNNREFNQTIDQNLADGIGSILILTESDRKRGKAGDGFQLKDFIEPLSFEQEIMANMQAILFRQNGRDRLLKNRFGEIDISIPEGTFQQLVYGQLSKSLIGWDTTQKSS